MDITYGVVEINGWKCKVPVAMKIEFQETFDAFISTAKMLDYKVKYEFFKGCVDIELTKKNNVMYKSMNLSFIKDLDSKLFIGLEVISTDSYETREDFRKLSTLDKLRYILKTL